MSVPPQAAALRSPLAAVFLLHIALEMPVAIQGLFSPMSLPFIQLNNTSIVLLKLYASLALGISLTSLLAYSLPDFLPAKRALAIGLCVYHSAVSTVLFQAPRFIPHSFGALAEANNVTPEVVWGTAHGIIGLGMIFWWQSTVGLTQQLAALQLSSFESVIILDFLRIEKRKSRRK